jgi:hypothetical protein
MSLWSGSWEQINSADSPIAPETVLAATYDLARDRLWVLDRAEDRLRLWLQDARENQRLVLEAPSHGRFADYYLRMDREGMVNLLASREGAGYAVIRSDGEAITGVSELGGRGFSLPPLFDEEGITLFLEGSEEEERVLSARLSSFEDVHLSLEALDKWF